MLKRAFLLTFTLAVLGALSGCSDSNAPPRKPGGLTVGDGAYDFKLMDSQKNWIRFSDVQEDWFTVLVLFRGSWCAACVNQLNELKEDHSRFLELRAALIAVSVESVPDLAEFQRQWRFPFPLLSDMGLKVVDAYGARDPKKNEDRFISRPCVIIVDPQKTVRYKYIGMNPHDVPHNAEIMELVRKFRKTSPAKP